MNKAMTGGYAVVNPKGELVAKSLRRRRKAAIHAYLKGLDTEVSWAMYRQWGYRIAHVTEIGLTITD
jgi:hypothetical protein